MKIKINQALMDVDGKTPVKEDGKIVTLKEACIGAILAPTKEDDQKKKFEKWEVFKKLRDAGEEVDLTADEIAMIEKCSGQIHHPLIYGQCYEMLEGKI
jgi:hypothetical protein